MPIISMIEYDISVIQNKDSELENTDISGVANNNIWITDNNNISTIKNDMDMKANNDLIESKNIFQRL